MAMVVLSRFHRSPRVDATAVPHTGIKPHLGPSKPDVQTFEAPRGTSRVRLPSPRRSSGRSRYMCRMERLPRM